MANEVEDAFMSGLATGMEKTAGRMGSAFATAKDKLMGKGKARAAYGKAADALKSRKGKAAAGVVGGAAAAYGGYKLYKKMKARKAMREQARA